MTTLRGWYATDYADDAYYEPPDEPDRDYQPDPDEDGDTYWPTPDEYESRHKPPRESARRKALFRKAERHLLAVAALAGTLSKLEILREAGRFYGRNGLVIALRIYIGNGRSMSWTPRGGYQVIEYDPDEIPF